MNERPGLMIYFDAWLPVLKSDDKTIAGLFRAAVMYAKYGEIPEFSGVEQILWEMIRPALDRDAERYTDTVKQRQYAGYCSAERRAGRDPLPLEEWESQRALTGVDERQPTTTTTPISTPAPTTTPTPNTITTQTQLQQQGEKETQGDAGGREGKTIPKDSYEAELFRNQEWERKRREGIAKLQALK